ncbi:uncharacterized protein LOC109541236 isoform X2 [Dendroctonus ponderosae]|uniref:EF-hand domain-containing protein n=1 Tax=Dendroctonus ponderosae TaxID=77166 RepID=A0AAR5PX72_DENPD|nr:uncharacterized protein LOC109541236 isoform X2 [Dendroctonus ponderosae]
MHCKQLKLGDVWRTCNKIRAAIFRIGINLSEYFKLLDPHKNCLISESQFISVIHGQLGGTIGLSEQEVAELADYFRVPDGRIYYTQLCDVINDSVPKFSENSSIITGLEWEDPLHTNRLSISEERRLNVLITKIASLVNMKKLILRPYFQDYELVSKNNGTVTIAHFARIMAYLGILLSADDFNLLVKKYLKDSYTLNYIAFLHAIDEVVQYLDRNGILDLSGDIMAIFPGRVINAELPKLPRPEIGKIMASKLFGKQNIFHPALEDPKKVEHILTTMSMIQEHVSRNRLRVNTFFKHFDVLNSGRISVDQFHRGLDALALNGKQRFFLSLPDVQAVINQYRDPCDSTRVCWKTFEDDVDHIFTIQELEKNPNVEVEIPQPKDDLVEASKLGGKDWQSVNTQHRSLCEDAVYKVKQKIIHRRILLKPMFKDFDKCNEQVISRINFHRGLITCGFELTRNEVETLMEVFASPMRQECVDYRRFAEVVEEAFTQSCLERAPLIVPIQHVPTKDCEKNFLNFDERLVLGVAMQKLSKKPDLKMNLSSVLKDFDKSNCGTVSTTHFLKALTLRGMYNLISNKEFDVICKCFGFERGMRHEVDYRAFMKALDILYATDKYNPF